MTEIAKLEKGILEKVPQIPYVVDQVGEALKWAKEDLSEGQYYKLLKITFSVAEYVTKISDSNFYKTHLVIATILSAIENAKDDERFNKFDSASKAVELTLNKVLVDQDVIKERGCFKALILHLVPLAKEDQECFATMLIGILNDLREITSGMDKAGVKAPITQADYITILGYSYVINNIFMSNLNLLVSVKEILNEINILLNGLIY